MNKLSNKLFNHDNIYLTFNNIDIIKPKFLLHQYMVSSKTLRRVSSKKICMLLVRGENVIINLWCIKKIFSCVAVETFSYDITITHQNEE